MLRKDSVGIYSFDRIEELEQTGIKFTTSEDRNQITVRASFDGGYALMIWVKRKHDYNAQFVRRLFKTASAGGY